MLICGFSLVGVLLVFTVFNYKSRDFSGSPAFTAVAPGSIIDRGIKFLQATQLGQKKKKL